MPRIKLVTNVSEYALLRGLVRTRARLIGSTVVATAATFFAGRWSAHYVLEVSSSVTLNLVLITCLMMLVLVSAYLQAVLVGDLFFDPSWREQVVLGQKTAEVTVKDYSAEFMIVLMLLVVLNGVGVNAVAGGFLDTYHAEGFFRSRLRAEDPAERRAALEDISDPLNFELWENTAVRQLVLGHLRDEDLEARQIAIWNTGEMEIHAARDELIAIAKDASEPNEVRAGAAEALGQLGNERSGHGGPFACGSPGGTVPAVSGSGSDLDRSPLCTVVASSCSPRCWSVARVRPNNRRPAPSSRSCPSA